MSALQPVMPPDVPSPAISIAPPRPGSCGTADAVVHSQKVAQVVVAEIVGQIRADVGGETRYEIPGYLRAFRRGLGHAEGATEQSADVILIIGKTLQMVITVAGHEMPLRTKVVVEADDAKIVVLRQLQAGQIALSVEAVARRRGQVIRQGHVFVPKLLHQWIDADAAGIAHLVAAGWIVAPVTGSTTGNGLML